MVLRALSRTTLRRLVYTNRKSISRPTFNRIVATSSPSDSNSQPLLAKWKKETLIPTVNFSWTCKKPTLLHKYWLLFQQRATKITRGRKREDDAYITHPTRAPSLPELPTPIVWVGCRQGRSYPSWRVACNLAEETLPVALLEVRYPSCWAKWPLRLREFRPQCLHGHCRYSGHRYRDFRRCPVQRSVL